jgi:small-conductance mechanosensitive channel
MEINLSFFNIAKLSSPLVLYLSLMIFLRVVLDKITFLKHPYFRQAFDTGKAILHTLIVIISLIVALGFFGVDVRGIFEGLGLVSFAIGLMFKDVVSSIVAGLSILLYKPFTLGDEITIEGIKGKVIKMDMRYTVLDAGGEIHLIPNASLGNIRITIAKNPLTS